MHDITSGPVAVRPAVVADAEAIVRIYNHYVETSVATFEERAVTAGDVVHRLERMSSGALPWLVAEEDGSPLGYAYAAPWKDRPAYRFAVEVTVYVDPERGGAGIGSRLYEQLLPLLKERGVHAVLAGIALPSAGSVALHEKFGFEKVAHFREVGSKFGRMVDVGYWQLLL